MNYIKQLTIKGFKKFKNLTIDFNKDKNIIIGANESGKSTILEAINIVLNQMYRNSDKYIIEELINKDNIKIFNDNPTIDNLPYIQIEIRFNLDNESIDHSIFHGENNLNGSNDIDFGILFECKFDKDNFGTELSSFINNKNIPYEYYLMSWKTFQGSSYNIYKKPLKSILIDTATIDTTNSFNYFNKILFQSQYDNNKIMHTKNIFRNKINSIFNNLKLNIDENKKFGLNNKKLVLESLISIIEDDIPLENKGRGLENLIKTEIALSKHKEEKYLDVVMIEEPENHLCYSNLREMIKTIEQKSSNSQLIITTHSSMIASTLNLRNILWIEKEKTSKLDSIDEDTAKFFTKADNNNLLQFLLSDKVFIVEGATEYILLPYFYQQYKKTTLEENKISIIPCGGISYNRYLKIANNMDKKIAVITDNDGEQKRINNAIEFNNEHEYQHIFMDQSTENFTWEASLYHANVINHQELESIIQPNSKAEYKFNGIIYGNGNNSVHEPILGKLLTDKANMAYKILISNIKLELPQYIKDAFEWIDE